jgi:hypothetical protein
MGTLFNWPHASASLTITQLAAYCASLRSQNDMFKRRDWLFTHGADGGGSDDDTSSEDDSSNSESEGQGPAFLDVFDAQSLPHACS